MCDRRETGGQCLIDTDDVNGLYLEGHKLSIPLMASLAGILFVIFLLRRFSYEESLVWCNVIFLHEKFNFFLNQAHDEEFKRVVNRSKHSNIWVCNICSYVIVALFIVDSVRIVTQDRRNFKTPRLPFSSIFHLNRIIRSKSNWFPDSSINVFRCLRAFCFVVLKSATYPEVDYFLMDFCKSVNRTRTLPTKWSGSDGSWHRYTGG